MPAGDPAVIYMSSYPSCDFPHTNDERSTDDDAHYDGKTQMGPWGFMCEKHFKEHGVGLGLGLGQRIILRTEGTERPPS